MGGNYTKDIYKQLMEVMQRCDSLEKDLRSVKVSSNAQIRSLNNEITHLDSKCNKLETENAALRQEVDGLTKENISLKRENSLLKEEILHLNSVSDNNSDNSSLPPSSDEKPSRKKANEYNGRTSSGKKTGGQKGHPGTMLSRELIEERIKSGRLEHTVENWVGGTPVSDAQVIPDTDYISHYIVDLEVRPVAKELRFYADPEGNHHIPPKYLSEVIYGDMVKILAVDLYSEGNVSLERTQDLISSLSGRAITVSQGSIFHFLKQFAAMGEQSLKQIELELLKEQALCTDATYTSTDGVRSYIRNFTSDHAVRFYPMDSKTIEAHEGIELLSMYDGILMHDHETAMYHFGKGHAECNVHLMRYLRKNSEDTGNTWSTDMIRLMTDSNNRRKELLGKQEFFTAEEAARITEEFKSLLAKGYEQNQKTQHKYAASEELALLNRLTKYQGCHLLFLYDEKVKFHNNDSERDLRKCKTHQKMSGGFRKESGIKLYCDIMSIVETCKKKGMQVYETIGSIFAGKRAIF